MTEALYQLSRAYADAMMAYTAACRATDNYRGNRKALDDPQHPLRKERTASFDRMLDVHAAMDKYCKEALDK